MKKTVKIVLMLLILVMVFSCNRKEYQIRMAKEHIEKMGDKLSNRQIEELYFNGEIYYGSNPEMAMLYFERIVELKPEAANYLAEYYYLKKDYVNYEKWAKYGAEKGISPATFNLGVYYKKKGDIENAIKYYLIAAKNKDEKAEDNLIVLYIERGNDEETKKILEELGYPGTNEELMIQKASYYRMKKEYDKSIEIYKELVKENSNLAYKEWGVTLGELGKVEESIEKYKKAIELGNIEAIYILAGMCLEEKKYEEARKYYLIGVKKGDGNSAVGVGETYELEENYEEAQKWYQKAKSMTDTKWVPGILESINGK